jgi:hypothetical protein
VSRVDEGASFIHSATTGQRRGGWPLCYACVRVMGAHERWLSINIIRATFPPGLSALCCVALAGSVRAEQRSVPCKRGQPSRGGMVFVCMCVSGPRVKMVFSVSD